MILFVTTQSTMSCYVLQAGTNDHMADELLGWHNVLSLKCLMRQSAAFDVFSRTSEKNAVQAPKSYSSLIIAAPFSATTYVTPMV